MKCKLLHDTEARPTIPPNDDILPKGYIMDDPLAYVLVQVGVAEAYDEECRVKADRSPKQLKRAQYEHTRTSKGIHPDDFARYDSGLLDGYNDDGSEIPGPNSVEEEEDSPIILPEGFDDEPEDEEEEN